MLSGMARMPAEWERHERCWMAFPPPNQTFGDTESLDAARVAWADVATTIAQYEPATLVAGLGQGPDALRYVGSHPAITVVERALDDAWMRDVGPTFVLSDAGGLAAVDWVFNGWGAQAWSAWESDARVAAAVAELAGVPVRPSRLVNEGGGIHVDGAGTVLLTETVQLGPERNPGWTRVEVEAEVHAQLGTTHAIWLPRGLTRDYDDYGTRGHVDIVATFVRPGVVAVHSQDDPAHPDHLVSQEILALLRSSCDAAGRPLQVVPVPAPSVLADSDGWVDYSYINHYVGNGVVVVGTFDDPADTAALMLLAQLYPGREIETADGRAIFANGGGVHCITQQQPAV